MARMAAVFYFCQAGIVASIVLQDVPKLPAFVGQDGHEVSDGSQVASVGLPIPEVQAVQLFQPKSSGRWFHLFESTGEKRNNGTTAKKAEQLSVNDVAFTYICGRDTYVDVIQQHVLKFTKKSHITRTPGKIGNNFMQALHESVDAFPDAKWYYICDDDNFVHVQRLIDLAAGYSSSENHIIGHVHGVRGHLCSNVNFESKTAGTLTGCDGPGWITGGPGVLVSRPAALAMKQKGCMDYNIIHGDQVLALCAMDTFGKSYKPEHTDRFVFNGEESFGDAIAIHHISPEVFKALGEKFQIAST